MCVKIIIKCDIISLFKGWLIKIAFSDKAAEFSYMSIFITYFSCLVLMLEPTYKITQTSRLLNNVLVAIDNESKPIHYTLLREDIKRHVYL